MMGVDKRHTTPYHPQGNSSVELINKTIGRYLRAFVDKQTLDWIYYLPLLQFSYNYSVNQATKTAPFDLIYQHQVNMPFFDDLAPLASMYNESSEIEFQKRTEKIRKFAIENNLTFIESFQQQHNKNAAETTIKAGDEVFLHDPTLSQKANCRKIVAKWRGPLKVVEVLNNNNALIWDKNKVRRIHLDRLRKYVSRKKPETLEEETVTQGQGQTLTAETDKSEQIEQQLQSNEDCIAKRTRSSKRYEVLSEDY
jgi:hypothetical protein